ncbi:MAG: hypothetical protein WBP59_02845 [Ilumatobacteraceae bacterium]
MDEQDRFRREDLDALSEYVQERWTAGADRDWNQPAGTLEWTCTATADHAVDTVFAPAFFLASGRRDAYPDMGDDYSVGVDAVPHQFVQALAIASRTLGAVVADASPDERAIIWQWPEITVAPPEDFLPRGGLELILHAHDVCAGLGIGFEPSPEICRRLRHHTLAWPLWLRWNGLAETDDPWSDLLRGSGRFRS